MSRPGPEGPLFPQRRWGGGGGGWGGVGWSHLCVCVCVSFFFFVLSGASSIVVFILAFHVKPQRNEFRRGSFTFRCEYFVAWNSPGRNYGRAFERSRGGSYGHATRNSGLSLAWSLARFQGNLLLVAYYCLICGVGFNMFSEAVQVGRLFFPRVS